MSVRAYRAEDRDVLYEICLKTGPGGEEAFADRRLLGEIFVGPYVDLEPELAFVVDDAAGVAGYVLGTRDTKAFERRCETDRWPALREAYPSGTFPDGTADARYVRLIHHPHSALEDVVATYPSHLHIDLLPRTQGKGLGRALIERLLEALRAAGSPGVHLGVGAENANAIGFYKHLGFRTLRETPGGRTMGLTLS